MNWFIFATIAPLLFAVSNYIDKYLVSKYFKDRGPGVLVIFSSLIGFFLLPVIYLIQPSAIKISPFFASLMVINGFIYIITLIPYLYTLQDNDTSVIVPLYQLIPVFAYGLGLVFLKESLTLLQILGSLLVMIGAVGISFGKNHIGFRFKKRSLFFMILSCFLIALNLVIFKFVATEESFWTTSFWEYVGFSICGIFLFVFIKSYREQFRQLFKSSKFKIISINAANEIINITGKIIKEKIERKYLLQKTAAVFIMFIGVYLLNI
jgi:bacterial/archaeal transporter family protein